VTLVEIEGRQLKLSNLEKVLYPETGFTKGQVLDYYMRIAPALLRQIKGRPLTLKRYPNGVDGQYFYEKQCPSHRPDWVQVTPVWSGHNVRTINFCLVEDLPTLIWVANLASLELHTALHRAAGSTGSPDERWTPDMVVFDLDPGEPAAFAECATVGLWLRESLDGLGLACFPKTSGSKGLQVYVPLNAPGVTYDQTKSFSRALAQIGERAHPKLVVSNMAKELRKGKVLIDWSQNDEHKTTVSVYSLRARPQPTVSAPLHWSEVEVAAGGGPVPRIEAPEAVRRLEADGDLFAPLLDLEQQLPAFG
jgi:bifunctional non-homologous end joining protein LigD